MAFKPEAYVVIDELLTEVLRGQLTVELQAEAIEGIITELLNIAWGPTDLGLCKTLCHVIIAPRSPIPLRDDFLAMKCLDQGEPHSKGVKGVQHKLVLAFAEAAYKCLGGDLSDKTAAMARAALHSRQRTKNTEYRRVFKALAQYHCSLGGTLHETFIAAIGGRPKEIPQTTVLRDELTEDLNLDAIEDEAPAEAAPPPPPKPSVTKSTPVQQALPLHLGALPKDEDDDDLSGLYIPRFADFERVFLSYPFLQIVNYEGQAHLGLGYLSGRLPGDGTLIRRNCTVRYWDEEGNDTEEVHFKKLIGRCGVLEQREGETRRFIKILPLKVGMVIRSWSNRKDQRDMEDMNRYSVVDLNYQVQTFTDEEAMKRARAVMRIECTRRGDLKSSLRPNPSRPPQGVSTQPCL